MGGGNISPKGIKDIEIELSGDYLKGGFGAIYANSYLKRGRFISGGKDDCYMRKYY